MEFAWGPEQLEFRARVQAFLRENLPADWEAHAEGPGCDYQAIFSKTFCPKLAKAGLLVPHWPKPWGGTEANAWAQFILAEEMWAHGEPRAGQYMNVNWIGPTLMKFGSEAQKARYLPLMARGETIWCQGFSERGSGSDLASLQTRADKDGDIYRINGRKIWTSYASFADTCFLLARTAPGRAGVTILLVPMKSKGLTVRRMPSLIGEGDIHELFFEDVEVPADSVLAGEGQAWDIARSALALERVGVPRYALAERALDRAVGTLKAGERFTGGALEQAARAKAACAAARLYAYESIDQRTRGNMPGAEASRVRIAIIAAERAVSEFVVEHLPEALAGGDPLMMAQHQRAIVASIAGGTAEVQLNLLASEFLKLPKEPR